MKYAKMSIADDQLYVTVDDDIIINLWPVSPEKIDSLIEEITKLSWEIFGIVGILPAPADKRLNISFRQFGKTISERLNCPVIYCDEGEIDIERIEDKFKAAEWHLDYYGYDPGKAEYTVESLLTTGNGFIGLRGAMPEMKISDDYYPATYLAGLYNETKSTVSDREIINEDFVNAPNFQYITVSIDGEKVAYTDGQVCELERHLNMRTGLFSARSVIRLKNGREVQINTDKFVSMANRNLYGISYEIKPLNFSGKLEIISEADGDVYNYNVERYRSLNRYHIVVDELYAKDNRVKLTSHTSTSNIKVIQESVLLSEKQLEWQNDISRSKITQHASVKLTENEPVKIEKLVHVEKLMPDTRAKSDSGEKPDHSDKYGFSSKPDSPDKEINPWEDLTSFDEMYAESVSAWEKLWKEAEITIEGDMMSEKMLRLHTYHLLVSASPLSAETLDVSVTARGLHGEAYRGHIFWDELFIFPFYIMHFPKTAKELLMYRYRRLKTAKEAAAVDGHRGAMYPWQSGLDGTEQSQLIHLNPMSGRWDPDNSRLQRHVSLAVAYNVWLYWKNTDDDDFMIGYGFEMLIEIAMFWISKSVYNHKLRRYSIEGVMGPDEFHEAYPGSDEGGLKDNAYTNLMASWLFDEVKKMTEYFPEDQVIKLRIKTGFSHEREDKMNKVMNSLNLEINKDGIIGQFAGYFDLEDIDLDFYRKKYGDIHRMDRILKAEGSSPDEYRVSKQADTLMAFYNFDKSYIDTILNRLEYDPDQDYFRKNLDYYLARTSHGSSLSRVVHTKLAAMAGEDEMSWKLYQDSLYSDYEDIQGGTVAEGIHTGVMASTIYITMCTFGGIDIREKELIIEPSLPPSWKKLKFNFHRKGIRYEIAVTPGKLKILAGRE